MKAMGCLKPVHLSKEGGSYFAYADNMVIETAKKLKWETIPAIVELVPDGSAKTAFGIRLKSSLAQIDFGPGPVGNVLRNMFSEYKTCFGENKSQFVEFASLQLGLPVKIIQQGLNNKQEEGIKSAEFFLMLNEVKKTNSLRYKSLSKARICPLCGWQVDKLSTPTKAMPAVIKEIILKKFDFLTHDMKRKEITMSISMIMHKLKQKFDDLRRMK